ncbi:MAG TPA: aminotransferase class IV [Dinghuibacter sp.]|uniref:aminotransferase class IV n=1 Tax=Dinghuibacter sp. TaxID=2024697 RepID=UPI002CBF16A8|nr:aminotransferase class IV [Dinghuibacter sp.]HTJ13822.1 aminotransferase class IV [Dinghuibacter sp.]
MQLVFDNRFYPADTLLVGASSRGLRYGDGLFETMKVRDGELLHASFHFDRLWDGLSVLGLPAPFSRQGLMDSILELSALNGHSASARVRLNVFRGEPVHHIIETFPLSTAPAADGLEIGVYPHGRKAFDAFSNLKHNNYLVYILAADWARAQGLDEALVLNAHERVADAATSNVFWVRSGELFTPPLSEAGVAGVTRRVLMERFPVREATVTPPALLEADEVFLTNAIRGVRWVRRFGEREYGHVFSAGI